MSLSAHPAAPDRASGPTTGHRPQRGRRWLVLAAVLSLLATTASTYGGGKKPPRLPPPEPPESATSKEPSPADSHAARFLEEALKAGRTRAARFEEINQRFERLEGGVIVHDHETALEWTAEDTPERLTREAADSYCADLAARARQDWRLPSHEELTAIQVPELLGQLPKISSGRQIWVRETDGTLHVLELDDKEWHGGGSVLCVHRVVGGT